jgi:redox-sensitive bicupin YhaK (pirin superfamily)
MTAPLLRRASKGHWVGDGFPVRTLFSYGDGPTISPFLLLDYAAPQHFAPAATPRGVGPHPHRGFSTVTIVFAGELAHRDSGGHGGTIGPGDVQWMTAANGVVHEEFHSEAFTRTGGAMEMVQLWVNLPAKAKRSPPSYQDVRAAATPTVMLPDGAGRVRVIAGTFGATTGPARSVTPVALWDVALADGAELPLAIVPSTWTRMLLVRRGAVRAEGVHAGPGDLLHWAPGVAAAEVRAAAAGTEAVLLAGEPIAEPVVGYGPFVMNTRAEIAEAIADFERGAMGRL